MTPLTPRDAAIDYARAGLRVFPLAEGSKVPGRTCSRNRDAKAEGREPTCRGECGEDGHGYLDATTDEARIRSWWREHPEGNIGIATGDGLLAVDLDVKAPPGGGLTGPDAVARLEAQIGKLPPTLTARSASGGLHLYYTVPPGRRFGNRARVRVDGVSSGLDTRGDGGYIVAPPSRLANGSAYTWKDKVTPAALPVAWLDFLYPLAGERPALPPPVALPGDSRERKYGLGVLRGACERIAAAAEGSRHDVIRAQARTVGGFVATGAIDRAEAEAALCAAGEATGKDAREVRRAVLWGLDAGAAAPLTVPDRGDYDTGRTWRDERPASSWADAPWPTDEDAPLHVEDEPGILPGAEPTHGEMDAAAGLAEVAAMPWAPGVGDWLTEEPPPVDFLLVHQPEGAWSPKGGILRRGVVGLLAAAGGSGKTWALCGLALSIATGRRWLGAFKPTGPGRVVLMLGEEDAAEVRRRLYWQARAMEIPADEAREAAERILTLPGAGNPHLALTRAEDQGDVETLFARGLVAYLRERGPWDAILVDPLSRFAGPDTEKDASAATRIMQVLERLAALDGRPSVIVAHHTRKPSGNAQGVTADDIRGSSALVAGARWAGALVPVDVEAGELGAPELAGAWFSVVKVNGGARVKSPIALVLDPQLHGAMRPATTAEASRMQAAEEANGRGDDGPTAKQREEALKIRREKTEIERRKVDLAEERKGRVVAGLPA